MKKPAARGNKAAPSRDSSGSQRRAKKEKRKASRSGSSLPPARKPKQTEASGSRSSTPPRQMPPTTAKPTSAHIARLQEQLRAANALGKIKQMAPRPQTSPNTWGWEQSPSPEQSVLLQKNPAGVVFSNAAAPASRSASSESRSSSVLSESSAGRQNSPATGRIAQLQEQLKATIAHGAKMKAELEKLKSPVVVDPRRSQRQGRSPARRKSSEGKRTLARGAAAAKAEASSGSSESEQEASASESGS